MGCSRVKQERIHFYEMAHLEQSTLWIACGLPAAEAEDTA